VLGGFVLGVVQALAIEYLPRGSDWKDVWAFVVLILVLTLRPQGLLGERVGART
jgi:branched-chain amino acid transport system permease protein